MKLSLILLSILTFNQYALANPSVLTCKAGDYSLVLEIDTLGCYSNMKDSAMFEILNYSSGKRLYLGTADTCNLYLSRQYVHNQTVLVPSAYFSITINSQDAQLKLNNESSGIGYIRDTSTLKFIKANGHTGSASFDMTKDCNYLEFSNSFFAPLAQKDQSKARLN